MSQKKMKAREILLTLAIKHKGDWNGIYTELQAKPQLSEEEINKALDIVNSKGIKFITLVDEEYPNGLKNSFKPPFVLFYYGNKEILTNEIEKIACLGTRDIDHYSMEGTQKYIDEFCEGKTIISNGKGNMDKIVCDKALQNKANLIIVLPNGLDQCDSYVKQYAESGKGLVISEYPTDTPMSQDGCWARNRIIASICNKVFVSSVKKQSGMIITLTMAIQNGKDIEILPQPCTSKLYNNHLILEGATPVVF